MSEQLPEDVPDWEDEYLDRVSDRLMHNYDLEKDVTVQGERFDMYGLFRVENQKQFLHESVNWANHEATEHLFARYADSITPDSVARLADFGDELADGWIEMNEEHYGTDFTFVTIVPSIPEDVRSYVRSYSGRTLLKFGYYGQYEIHLAVVSPENETAVASKNADIANAFALWGDVPSLNEGSLFTRLFRKLTY